MEMTKYYSILLNITGKQYSMIMWDWLLLYIKYYLEFSKFNDPLEILHLIKIDF